MAIQPLALDPNIRQVGDSDVLGSVSIKAVDEALTSRDNLINNKLTEVVSVVNALEQLVGIPLPRVTLVPSETLIFGNFRIPAGQKARVVNACVAGSVANQGLLEVVYNPTTFGSTTGTTVVVQTLSEYTSVGQYLATGELIFKLTNQTTSTVELAVSILIGLVTA